MKQICFLFFIFFVACNEDVPVTDSDIDIVIKPEKVFSYSVYSRDTFEGKFRTPFVIYEITFPGKLDGRVMLFENIGIMKETQKFFSYDPIRDVSFTQLVEHFDWLPADELRYYPPGKERPTQRISMGKNYSIYSRSSASEWILKTTTDTLWAFFDIKGDTTMVKPINEERTIFTIKKGGSVMGGDVCQASFAQRFKADIVELLFIPE